MNIEKFKKESSVTFVQCSGKLLPSKERFNSYISVPYRYDEIVEFDTQQIKAICESEFVKAGVVVKLDFCNIDTFFNASKESEETEKNC